MSVTLNCKPYSWRKWLGVVWLFVELNLAGGTVFGLSALFKVLPKYGIYGNRCIFTTAINSTVGIVKNCNGQTRQYQNALTLGIIFYDIPAVFVGILIDKFGTRSLKLIAFVCHVIGWLSLSLTISGRDYFLYFHTVLTSLSGIILLITSYTSCDYFSKSRAFVTTLLAGAATSSGMWFSIFQVLIDKQLLTLQQLSYIWMSFGCLILVSSFLFLDWKFRLFNLPYKFNTNSENSSKEIEDSTLIKMKWYKQIRQRIGIWKHLSNRLYIVVVLFLSILLLSSTFLPITWYPWVFYITNQNVSLADNYTFAFNLSMIAFTVICPIIGFVLGFRVDRSRKQKLLNIALVQTLSWLLNICSCVICMFPKSVVIIPVLVINCIARGTITAGSQAIVTTFFPSKYIGTLSGILWTVVGAITFFQYALLKLTDDISMSWRAWAIILGLVILMSCHLVQIWYAYFRERKSQSQPEEDMITRF